MSLSAFVVGCGSIGLRHIRNLEALDGIRVLATDPDPEARERARTAGAVLFDSLAAGLDHQPSLVMVCTPPHLHVAVARAAVAADADVFIEKPIDVAVTSELDALLAEARTRRRLVAVGYNLRFHAGVRALRQALQSGTIGSPLLIDAEFGYYLPDWRPGRDYRLNYGARRSEGGGILLDASHEVDYLRWIAGEVSSVYAIIERVSALAIDVEDVALLSLRLMSGAVAQVRLDCVQRRYSRRCKIAGSEGVLEWTWRSGLRSWRPDNDEPTLLEGPPDPDRMYVDELRDLVDAVLTRRAPEVTGEDARRTLEVIDAARRAARDRVEASV